jgi:hypothetical protein
LPWDCAGICPQTKAAAENTETAADPMPILAQGSGLHRKVAASLLFHKQIAWTLLKANNTGGIIACFEKAGVSVYILRISVFQACS